MVLAYYGIYRSKMQIHDWIGVDPTPYTPSPKTWGNPHEHFVGDILGNSRGYGVYWEPIQNYIHAQGRSTKLYRGASISDVAHEIEKGHPVILWWYNGWSGGDVISWHTPSGQKIYAFNGMHSEVLVGFKGDASNPSALITRDPWRGRRVYSVNSFLWVWGFLNNTGVAVY